MSSEQLKGKIAIVAGASRGAGKGIALALGDAGATVYVTGRTTHEGRKPADAAPGTIEETAAEVSARGGKGIAVRVDHTVEEDVRALFERVRLEQGRVDILANAVWSAADGFNPAETDEDRMAAWSKTFWQQPARNWQHMITGGPYAYFLNCHAAAPIMAAQGGGLIVGVTDGVIEGVNPNDYGGQLVWDLAHLCINRILLGVGHELKPHNVAVVTLMPGFLQTERVLMSLKTDEMKKMFRFDKSESTQYLGRAVASLAADPNVLQKTCKLLFVADLAKEYGFTDIDGRYVPRFNPFA